MLRETVRASRTPPSIGTGQVTPPWAGVVQPARHEAVAAVLGDHQVRPRPDDERHGARDRDHKASAVAELAQQILGQRARRRRHQDSVEGRTVPAAQGMGIRLFDRGPLEARRSEIVRSDRHQCGNDLEAEDAPHRAQKDTVRFVYRDGVPYDLVERIAAALAAQHRAEA